MKKKYSLFIILILSLSISITASATERIIVTIKPLHSLVAGVLGNTEEASLLVDANISPHGFNLKPSQLQSMQKADIIFYIDDSFETFLHRAFEVLPDNVDKISVARESGITLLTYRNDETSDMVDDEHHDEEHHHHHHTDGAYDMHIWLDPANAIKIVALIADKLIARYPANQATYQANASTLVAKLNRLDAKLKTYLYPIKDQAFITFHDAYQYFERAYGLNYAGAISLGDNMPLSPSRILAIHEKLRHAGATCIFKEPQFPDRIIETIGEDFDVKIGVLDPLGAEFTNGADLYFELLNNMAQNLRQCLE